MLLRRSGRGQDALERILLFILVAGLALVVWSTLADGLRKVWSRLRPRILTLWEQR